MKITTLHTFDTEYSADSVEWCPFAGYQDYFVCGTYQVVEKSAATPEAAEEEEAAEAAISECQRKGRLYLFRFVREGHSKVTFLQEVQRLETAAILDMKWLPLEQQDGGSVVEDARQMPLLAIATAQGRIEIYALKGESQADVRLVFQCAADLVAEENTGKRPLALSLDWRSGRIIVSDSTGGITLLACCVVGGGAVMLEIVSNSTAHGFEAWTCAFDRWNANRVFSGGDDMLLLVHDLRTQEPIMTNRSHEAGVTSLLSHPRREHQLITGSYDERVRLFDSRLMKRPLAELPLNGGIWRLKPDPLAGDCLLTACMYKNFSVVRLLGDADLTLAGTYEEHSNICYGADWCPLADELGWYMATCSFYDHKLCVARVEVE